MTLRRALGLAWAASLALLACLAGCDSGGSQLVFTVHVIDPAGGNPLTGSAAASLRFTVRQADGDAVVSTTPVVDGSFEAVIAFDPALAPTYVAVEVLDDADQVLLLGAAPAFAPAETNLLLYVVVGAPGTCDILAGESFDAPRVQGATPVYSGTFAMFLGGLEAGGPSARVEAFDLLRLVVESAGSSSDFPFAPLPAPTGAAVAAPLDAVSSLVLSEDAAPFIHRFGGDPATSAITLHAGAGAESALAPVGARGVLVAGGRDGAPVDSVTWVAPDGTLTAANLALPRAGASALALSDDVVVVAGGMVDGAATIELVRAEQAIGVPVAGTDGLGQRDAPLLFADADGAQVLVIGGTDGMGQPRPETLLLTGCPDACAYQAGPTWSEARAGAGWRPGQPFVLGGDGPSDRVERVRFGAGSASLALEASLAVPRRVPALVPLGAGVTLALTGEGASGLRDDVEVCFPLSLDPR